MTHTHTHIFGLFIIWHKKVKYIMHRTHSKTLKLVTNKPKIKHPKNLTKMRKRKTSLPPEGAGNLPEKKHKSNVSPPFISVHS